MRINLVCPWWSTTVPNMTYKPFRQLLYLQGSWLFAPYPPIGLVLEMRGVGGEIVGSDRDCDCRRNSIRERLAQYALGRRSWSTLVDVCAWEQCARARNHSVHFFLQRFRPFAGLYYLLGFRAPEYSKLTNRRGGCIVVRAENQDQASSGCFFRITFCIFHQPTYYGNR